MSETRKVYVTTYALTGGVQLRTVRSTQKSESLGQLVYFGGGFSGYIMGREAFDTEAEARLDFEARRAKKLASLKKQIAKLEKLTFRVKEGE